MDAIQFQGLDAVIDALDKIKNPLGIEQALKDACVLVEREAKIKAPKVDGALRNSITSKVEGLSGVVFSPLEYAPYVEYGTGLFSVHPNGGRTWDLPWKYQDEKTGEWHMSKGQHPQPYMFPALNENREEIIRIIREGITKK